MKAKLIAPRSACREMEAGPDLDRLLSGGSWLIAAPKARTKAAGHMRSLRTRRREAGWANLNLWFDPEQLAAISSALRPGETVAQLVMRLIKQSSLP